MGLGFWVWVWGCSVGIWVERDGQLSGLTVARGVEDESEDDDLDYCLFSDRRLKVPRKLSKLVLADVFAEMADQSITGDLVAMTSGLGEDGVKVEDEKFVSFSSRISVFGTFCSGDC
jgi:hypothetical protein